MLMQNFGVTNKEYYGMLWYFLEWSIVIVRSVVTLMSGVTVMKVVTLISVVTASLMKFFALNN